MMWRVLLSLVASIAAFSCFGAEPFELQLSSLSKAWFPGGAVIKVPADVCSELQVKLRKPWSRETRIESVELKLDSSYPRFQRLISADEYLLNVTTREPLGLLTRDTHHIAASATEKNGVSSSWTVIRWKEPYLEGVVAGAEGLPIGIQLDSPLGGLVLVGPDQAARFRGKLSGSADAQLTINGQKIGRMVNKPGYEFDQKVSIEPGYKEVTVRGDDKAGDATILVLRIQNQ